MTPQIFHRPLILIADNRRLKVRFEFLVRQQIARHQKIKDRPKLRQRVLDGRSGQGKVTACPDLLDSAGILRHRILDMLRFIQMQ